MSIHWAIAKETHTDETNQMWGTILAYCGTGQESEEKAYDAMDTIQDEKGEHNGRMVTVMRFLEPVKPGSKTKICF